MTIVDTSSADLGYIVESVAGTTPATPAMQLLPITSGSPDGNTETKSSEEIRSDRMDLDLTVVDKNIAGTMNYELTYVPYKPLLAALMAGPAVVTLSETQTDIAAAASGKTFTSAALADFSAIGAGDFILVSGFTGDASNNGIFKVASASTLVITLDSSETLVDDSAGESVTITANRYTNGNNSIVPNSYTFMKRIQQITTPAYMYYRGCMINGINWDFSVGDFVKGDFDIIGLTEEITESEIASSTYPAVSTHPLMSSASSATIESAGLGAGIDVEKMTVKYDNHIEAAKAVGTLGAVALKAMTLELTGELTIYFENIAAYTLLAASTSFELTLKITDGDANWIILHLPECKFENLESPMPGKDQFFFINGTYKAFKDATLGYAAAMHLIDAH